MRLIRLKVFIIITVCLFHSNASIDESTVFSAAPPSVVYELLALNRDLPTLTKPKYLSSTDIVASTDGMLLFIAQQTAKRVDIIDATLNHFVGSIHLPNEVTGIAVSADARTLYATCSSRWWPAGMVCVADVETRHVRERIGAGHGVRAPVLSPDGDYLYVCNRFNNDVGIVDLTAGKMIKRISVLREPYCSAITPDGKTLVAGNLLPADRSTDTNTIAAAVSLIDLQAGTAEHVKLWLGSSGITGVAVSPDGNYAFATHTMAKFTMIQTSVMHGWGHTNNVAVIDLKTGQLVDAISLDKATVGRADPWDVVCTEDGEHLVVSHAGSSELSVVELPAFIDTVKARSKSEDAFSKNFTALNDIMSIAGITVEGPRAITVAQNNVYIVGYFDDRFSLQIVPLTLEKSSDITFFTFTDAAADVPLTSERKGEALFYDAALCYQKWRSCHTCHTLTYSNGLNHLLGGGATVAPKNTKALLYSWWTPPTTWSGRRGHAKQAIETSIQSELFESPSDEITNPLDTFLMNLRPVPSPYLEKGRLSEAAQRGKALFNGDRAQCYVCHEGPLFTDNEGWNVGLPDPFDANTVWITPSLTGAWRSAPYGHLGGYPTLTEIITQPGHTDAATELTTGEIDDLVAYVLSL